ncbi:unnamed protein product [Allacma fusca]|uniref:Uncharacterized protein n=1 Tax=Allacma fusca TaxID=39272 RepID=A0A8J2KZ27_9HEXA|nr:unnamed protein product [Allacma fusca]
MASAQEDSLELREADVHLSPTTTTTTTTTVTPKSGQIPTNVAALLASATASLSIGPNSAIKPDPVTVLVQPEELNLIYFAVGDKSEIALVPTNSSSDDIKGEFVFGHIDPNL